MPENELKKIADKADMIIAGYSFTKDGDAFIRILNLENPEEACVLRRDGEMVETTMDDITHIKLNHETMFEMWSRDSVHGYYGDNR